MPNNSNNSDYGWRQKLGEFEDVPGNNLDKEAAWNKLQQKKPVQKTYKKTWYWLAAACLAGTGMFLANNGNYKKVENNPPSIVKTIAPVIPEETVGTIIQNSPAVTNYTKEKASQKKYIPLAASLDKKNDIAEELLVVTEQQEPVQQNIPGIDSVAKRAIPVIAATKKLKVLHINELNQSQNNSDIAQQEGRPYFPINYRTRQVYTNNTGNTKGGKDNLIRIRLN
ncbi:MAG: hypothetical protein H7Y86_03610 [Rhizobacter sp.]|nr:hypothetical protein [Ferruginibacter sp.]